MRWSCYMKVIVLIAITAYIAGCSPKSNKTLAIFFDGVPDPGLSDTLLVEDSLFASETEVQLNKPVKPSFVFHSPYAEKECASCHNEGSMGRLTEPMPGLCYQCHEDFKDRYAVLHGPVAGGFCTDCHNPHLSRNKSLIIRTGQYLCLNCHNREDVFKNESHMDIEESDCTDCHNPHGGDDRYIFY